MGKKCWLDKIIFFSHVGINEVRLKHKKFWGMKAVDQGGSEEAKGGLVRVSNFELTNLKNNVFPLWDY